MEPQQTNHHNDQGRQEERYRNIQHNHRTGQLNHLHCDNDPYSDEEEQEEEDYPSNDRYNPRGGCPYDNQRTTNNCGGQVEPRMYGGNRQSRNQRNNDESSEEERRNDYRHEYR